MAVAAAFAMWPYLISWRASRNRIPISRARMWIFIVILATVTVTEIVLIANAIDSDHPIAGIFAVTLVEAVIYAIVGHLFRAPEA
jgi:hypothetical protein